MNTRSAVWVDVPVVPLPGVPDTAVIGVIPAGQLAELGIAVDVPILQVRWFDERQCCTTVHAYLSGDIDGTPAEYTGCSSYRDGQCGGVGWERPCLFHEPETSDGWRKARSWELVSLDDGTTALAKREVAASIRAERQAVGELVQ